MLETSTDVAKGAGVDMNQPEPVEIALNEFSKLVQELDDRILAHPQSS